MSGTSSSSSSARGGGRGTGMHTGMGTGTGTGRPTATETYSLVPVSVSTTNRTTRTAAAAGGGIGGLLFFVLLGALLYYRRRAVAAKKTEPFPVSQQQKLYNGSNPSLSKVTSDPTDTQGSQDDPAIINSDPFHVDVPENSGSRSIGRTKEAEPHLDPETVLSHAFVSHQGKSSPLPAYEQQAITNASATQTNVDTPSQHETERTESGK